MNLPYREHCLNPIFEFSPHNVFHNVFFITAFPLVCQPSGLWGHLEWHIADGASTLELIGPHCSSLLPKRSHYRHNRSPPPSCPCNLSWWTRFHNISALSEGVTVWTFILHMWLNQAGIMCCAANIGVNDLCAGMRGVGNSHMYHVIIIITLRSCREMLLFPDSLRVQPSYESCIIASAGGLQTDAEDVVW